MKEEIKVYSVSDSSNHKAKYIGKTYIENITVDKEDIKDAIAELDKYALHYFYNSYYESYYDDSWETYGDLSPSNILLQDGKLIGFVVSGDYSNVILLRDADTGKKFELEYGSTDHGDTMSGSSKHVELISRKNIK